MSTDKQQAAEDYAKGFVYPERDYIINNFIAGWEAHEALADTDAIRLLNWIGESGFWRTTLGLWESAQVKEKHTTEKLLKLYALCKPSGEAHEAHLADAEHTIEPNWKQEMAELHARVDTDPFKKAMTKIYDLMQGVADDNLKGVLCMAFLKQAIELLVKEVAELDKDMPVPQSIYGIDWSNGEDKTVKVTIEGGKVVKVEDYVPSPSPPAAGLVKLPDGFYNCLPYGYEFVNEEPLISNNYTSDDAIIEGECTLSMLMKATGKDPFIRKHLTKIKELTKHYAELSLAAGPVWVKCIERMPVDTKRPKPPKRIFVKWLHSGELESGEVMTVNQLIDRIKGNVYDEDFQWLDESGSAPTQQVFTREQLFEGLLRLSKKVIAGFVPFENDLKNWFNTNYPPTL